MTEIGIVMEASPGYTARLAGEIEAMGFDVLLCPDTQNLSPDPLGQLSLATQTTSRLKLGTGVTNPVTRDVAVNRRRAGNNAGRVRRTCDLRHRPR